MSEVQPTTIDVTIPAVGVAMTEATIVRWIVDVGDHVDEGAVLAEVETDKAIMELEAPAAGVVAELLAAPDETVDVGAPVARIAAGRSAGPTSAAAPVNPPAPAIEESPPPASEDGSLNTRPHPPAKDVTRQPHAQPPRTRFADRTGVRGSADSVTVASPTEPIATGNPPLPTMVGGDWLLTKEVPITLLLSRVQQERASGQALVSLTDALISAVARALGQVTADRAHDLRLAVTTDSHVAFPSLPGSSAKNLSELAADRLRAIDAAWATHEGPPIDASTLTVIVFNAGRLGPDVLGPPTLGSSVVGVGFGAARPRVWVTGDGIGIRTTITVSVRAPGAQLRPFNLHTFFNALIDKVGH